MAFKTMKQYNDERYGGLFRLPNNNDSANVVFLYRGVDDVLVVDAHYIKSSDYSGYVHCCGRGCPACGKGIRIQNKLFIPLYNLDAEEIQFWDRTTFFEDQLNRDVLDKYPDPSQYVFTITRRGEARSMDTHYDILATSKYSSESYDQILARFGIKLPEHYDTICKEFSAQELATMLNKSAESAPADTDSLPDYSVTPRVSSRSATVTEVSTPIYTPVPEGDLVNPDDAFGDSEIDNVDF